MADKKNVGRSGKPGIHQRKASEASLSISDQDRKPKGSGEKKSGQQKNSPKKSSPKNGGEKKTEEPKKSEEPKKKKQKKPLPTEPIPAIDEFVEKTNLGRVQEAFDELNKIETRNTETWKKKKELCRHPDIPCEEETRFVLKGGKEDNDFIHANKVTVEGAERSYIVAMAPTKRTMEDFWRMVYQARPMGIAVFGAFYQEGKEVSEQFWPSALGERKRFGRTEVALGEITHRQDRTIYFLGMTVDGEKQPFYTRLHHLLFWSSYEPFSYKSLVRIAAWARWLSEVLPKEEQGPVIAVSSQGVNRACTFVLVDVLLYRLFKNIPTQLVDVAKEIRKQRAWAFNLLDLFNAVATVLYYILVKFPKHIRANELFLKSIREKYE